MVSAAVSCSMSGCVSGCHSMRGSNLGCGHGQRKTSHSSVGCGVSCSMSSSMSNRMEWNTYHKQKAVLESKVELWLLWPIRLSILLPYDRVCALSVYKLPANKKTKRKNRKMVSAVSAKRANEQMINNRNNLWDDT